MWSGFPKLHSSPSSISQGVRWDRSPNLGPETTSPCSETAEDPLPQQHSDWTQGRIYRRKTWCEIMCVLAGKFSVYTLLYWSFLISCCQILELCYCVQESQDHQLAKEFVGTRPTLELRNIWLLPNDIEALAFVANSVGDNGIGLDFGACSMELECLDVLPRCQYIHCLRYVTVTQSDWCIASIQQ